MKRTIAVTALLLGAAVLFAQEAVIREITGTVEVKGPGAAAWSPAARGQAVGRDVMISTGFKSSAVIAIGDSTLTVQPLTRLSLEELIRGDGRERVAINLRAGRIRAEVRPPEGMKTDFTVKSPVATASVRGTSFEFDGVALKVDEGRVHVAGGDGAGTYVAAGHEVKMDMETGRTSGVIERAREELTPPVPAGTGGAVEAPAAASPAADMAVGF
ncbi:MAG: FecR family protein, partial [Treponema sp.]|nr:FecR family protein [Treponema sp.]